MVRLSRLPSALASGFFSAAFATGLAATSALDIGAPGFFLAAAIACTADICLVCYGDCFLGVKPPCRLRKEHVAGQYRPAHRIRGTYVARISSDPFSKRTFSQDLSASGNRARLRSRGVVDFDDRDRRLRCRRDCRSLDAHSLVRGGDRRRRRDPARTAGAASFFRPHRRRQDWADRLCRRGERSCCHALVAHPPMDSEKDKVSAKRGWLRDNPYVLLALAALFWSGNHIVGRAIGGEVPPIGISTVRWLLPTIALGLFAFPHIKRDWPVIRTHWGILLWLGIVGGALFTAGQYIGLQYTTAL